MERERRDREGMIRGSRGEKCTNRFALLWKLATLRYTLMENVDTEVHFDGQKRREIRREKREKE